MMKQLKNFAPRYGRLRYLLHLIILIVPVLLVGCRDDRRARLPTPDLDVLVPTPTPPVVRIEVVVMVVTPSAAPPASAEAGGAAAEPQSNGASGAIAEGTATPQPPANAGATQEGQSSATQSEPASDEALISAGEEVYRNNCAACHQNNGEGSSAYPALNQNGVLTAGDPTQPIQIVLHGRGEMPSFEDDLSNRQIAAVLSYERNSWENSASVVTVDQVRQVRQGGSAGMSTAEATSAEPAAESGATEAAPTADVTATAATSQPNAGDGTNATETATTEPTAEATAAETSAAAGEQAAAAQPETGATASATTAAANVDEQALLEQGNTIYASECASCHQLSGEGTNTYPALNNSALLTDDDPTAAITTVLYGRGEMPAFIDLLSTQEIAAVLSHERNAWDNNASVVTAAQVAAVQQGETGSTREEGAESATAEPTATEEGETATASPAATVESTPAGESATTPTVTASAMATTAVTTTTATATAVNTAATTPTPATPPANATITPPLTWTPAREVTPLLPANAQAGETATGTAATATTPTPAPSTGTPAEEATAAPSVTGTTTAAATEQASAQATGQATPQASGSEGSDALIARGEEVYARECASCHRVSGEGTSEYPALNNSALLTDEDPTAAIQKVLLGEGEMPAFADLLSNEEIAAVLSYERNSWDNAAATVSVADVEAVRSSSTDGETE